MGGYINSGFSKMQQKIVCTETSITEWSTKM